VLTSVGVTVNAADRLTNLFAELVERFGSLDAAEREIRKTFTTAEKRGQKERNRLERNVKARRRDFERTIKRNRTRVEREVRSIRRDVPVVNTTATIVKSAQERIGSLV
jgi:hypothetical protein